MANLCITSLIFLSFLPIICLSFSPENPTDWRILVLLDDFALKSSYSIFFKALQNRGFELDFKLADNRQINLQRYGQYMYDGLVLFAPNTERFGGSLDLADVLDFVDSGHDLILSADVNASDLIRNIAAECGVDFDEHQYKHRGSHTVKFEFENPNTHLRVCHTAVGKEATHSSSKTLTHKW